MTILITGATGQLGRLVVDALVRRTSLSKLAVSVRDPQKAGPLAARGIAVRQGDFDRPDDLAGTFVGTETLLVISGDAPVDVRIRQHRNAVDAAGAAGVGRVVYTSFVDPRPENPFPFAAIHADTEAYIQASGLPHTILRNGVYADNLMGFIGRAVDSGTLAAPAGDGKVAFVSRADLAEATATVLLGDGHAGRVYELTGPTAVDYAAVAAAVARRTGKPIAYQPITSAAFQEGLSRSGLPPFMVDALAGLFEAVAGDAYATVTGDTAALAGRAPEDIDNFLARMLA